MAKPTPVLPAVASMIVPPGRSQPRLSASAIMAMATRSLTLPPGFMDSTLIQIAACSPSLTRRSRTNGVRPTDWRMLSCMVASLLSWVIVARVGAWRQDDSGGGWWLVKIASDRYRHSRLTNHRSPATNHLSYLRWNRRCPILPRQLRCAKECGASCLQLKSRAYGAASTDCYLVASRARAGAIHAS